jgi:hypothetical protein
VTDVFRDFLQSLQSNAGPIGHTSIRPWPITFTSFSFQKSPIILPFDAILYEKLTAPLNKSQIKQNLNLNEDLHNFIPFNYFGDKIKDDNKVGTCVEFERDTKF